MSSSEISETTGLRVAAAQVARWTHQGLDPDQFYQQFLDHLPVPTGTLGTAAWHKQGNVLRSIARGSRNPPEGLQLPYSNQQHAEILGRVAASGTWEIVAPRRSDHLQPFVDTSPPLAIFPVARRDDQAYLVEVFLPPNLAEDELRSFALQTELLCGIAAAYHEPAADHTGSATEPAIAGPFLQEIHRALNVTETCFAITNEGQAVLGCDRVAVLVRSGQHYKVRAVSSQDDVNPRANVVQFLQRLVDRTMAIGEPFWYPPSESRIAPEIEQSLEQYVEISLCRTLGILPLRPAAPRQLDTDSTETVRTTDVPPPVGALVVERFSEQGSGLTQLRGRAEAAAVHGGIALANALEHERIFLLPLWKRLGAMRAFLLGSRRAATLTAATGLFAFLVVLALVPAELKVSSEGRLEPMHRRNVFAKWDGTVVALHVRHGDPVAKETALADMRSELIELEIQRLQGEIATNQQRLQAIRTQRLSDEGSQAQDVPAHGEDAVEQQDLERLLESLGAQLDIQRERQRQLSVTSPIAGHVLTWDLQELLQDRPVRRGQFLMEVADLAGPWCLELDVPDRRTMHVLRADERSAKPLAVSFLLASDPKRRHTGTVLEITQATNVDPDKGQFVRMKVAVDAGTIPFRQPGTKVQAKIHCGKHRLGYVWFHQVWEFIQSHVLFRLR